MSLVNEMLRDLDKRRQSSPAAEGANATRTPDPRQLPPASTTRWLPLGVLVLLVVMGAVGLWLYDHPQLWRTAGSAAGNISSESPAAPSAAPLKVAADTGVSEPSAVIAKTDPQIAVAQAQIIRVEWAHEPSLRLVLTLNQAPPQRVLVSTPRTLQLDLGPVDLAVELPETSAGLIRSAQFVNQNGHLTLELETYQDAAFRVVGRSGHQQHRLLLSIDPQVPMAASVMAETATAEAVTTRAVTTEIAIAEPVAASPLKPEASTLSVETSSRSSLTPPKLAPVASANAVLQSAPTAILHKRAPQSLEQRDQAVVAQALEQVNRRQLPRAQQLLEAMLQQDPDASSSRTLLATLKIGAQQSDQAEQLIDTGLALDSSHAGLRKLKARLLIQRGAVTAAVALLSDSHPEVASDPEFHQIRAAALQAAGEHQQAAEAYHELLQWRASEPRWWIGLALSLEALQQPQQAKKAYQNVFKIPQVPPVLADFVSQRLAQLGG